MCKVVNYNLNLKMASSIVFVNQKGDILIYRRYRDDVRYVIIKNHSIIKHQYYIIPLYFRNVLDFN